MLGLLRRCLRSRKAIPDRIGIIKWIAELCLNCEQCKIGRVLINAPVVLNIAHWKRDRRARGVSINFKNQTLDSDDWKCEDEVCSDDDKLHGPELALTCGIDTVNSDPPILSISRKAQTTLPLLIQKLHITIQIVGVGWSGSESDNTEVLELGVWLEEEGTLGAKDPELDERPRVLRRWAGR
ncbi:hypothetical protein BDQ17DRAFT_1327184 [Cyathus striatus]|nr:hypothetical protein BDQ17DRAFT_1327184 [Cyathus striatus]